MPPRILRLLLLSTLVAVGSGGVFWTWTLAQHVADVERAGRQTATRIDRLEISLDELIRLELMEARSGQLDADTLAAGTALLGQLASETSTLLRETVASSSPAAAALARETPKMAEAAKHARDNERELSAIDPALGATTRIRQSLRDHLRALRRAEAEAVADARASAIRQAWAPLAAVALVFAWALIRSSRVPSSTAPGHLGSIGTTAQTATEDAPVASSAHVIDLVETAALCTAIGRLQSEAGLPDLLARAATVLEASGVVLWMAAGEELFPVAGHGYHPGQWRQLAPINHSARNATAAAWRSGALATVPAGATGSAALVAPLLGAERCVGVLAVEVVPGTEREPAMQAAASLIAAQLAAVLVAWPAASSATVDVAPFERASASAS